jgi:aminoglycoside phosphotransferase (APT) family kinase protein
MAEARDDGKFKRLIHKFDPQSKLLRTWELNGGVSAQVTALEIFRPGGLTKRMVVRRHGDVDFKRNPHVAADEFKLLTILRSAGLPTPAPYFLDESGDLFTRPCIVVEYIEGEPEFAPTDLTDLLIQLATHLSGIHNLDCSNLDLSFLPQQEKIYAEKFRERPARVDESLDEGRIRDTLESAWPWPRRNEYALLHGDYWPGNILWRDGRLAGIIDWEDAQWGDPLADLANTRLELLWAFGIEAMHSFTGHYEALTTIDFADLPYWDLCAALRPAFRIAEWAGDETAEKRMRERHKLFIAQAFEKLSVQ